ncbi:hypothetical protein [Rhodovulum sp.]|uniref:hypothetical protein n=1 Tax=Rhodovulum sp. TaxID=34009 RepID=UPI0017DD9391|nr:hypothetical protein [Rhodovulum sp.]HDR28614.1 hypothetical protein [Rhodovulum sp.]
MRIAITGAAGFLGQMLVTALSVRDTLALNGEQRRISAIIANDISAEPLDRLARLRRVHALPGALSDPATLARLAGPETAALIRPAPDPATEAIVASWPGGIDTPRARALGFAPNADFAELLREHMDRRGVAAA